VSSDDRFFVYILSNASRTLYVGMTNDLVRRVYEHEQKQTPGFTARYMSRSPSTTRRPRTHR
jgi:putative endonuclease